MRRVSILSVVIVLLMTGALWAQDVNVLVNGEPVDFQGTQAQIVQGRVLVPLRGVLEEMGAYVEWRAADRTVIAQRGGTTVQLPIGSRVATVNNQRVTLDVPAQILGGRTMVPLRFLSEALGADVRWQSATRTVFISTTGAPIPQPGEGLRIASFSHDATGWLRGGQTLNVTMTGTPGGIATFEIPGVVSQVRMREVSPGRYTASWTVPRNADLTISGASVIGRLQAGGEERLIQAGNPIAIDTVAPDIVELSPEPNTRIATQRPSISAVFDDGAGSGIRRTSVTMTVNGRNVTDEATITDVFISYRPQNALPTGRNTVTVAAQDQAGNNVSRTWSFVVGAAADVIESFTFDEPDDLEPGDVIEIRLEGVPGGTATYSIISPTREIRNRQMREISPGVYVGEYTIRRGDVLAGALVTGTLTTPAGETYTVEADRRIGGVAGAIAPPNITSPQPGATVSSPLTITGTAPAGTRVRLHVEYATTVLGALRLTGVVADQVVQVGTNGRFTSDPIDLGTLVRGRNTEYTITATTIGPEGVESEPTVVTVQGS